MTATVELTKRTALEEMIVAKQKALAEAKESAEFYQSIGQTDMADNEASRARLLERQIKSLTKIKVNKAITVNLSKAPVVYIV